MKAAYPATKVEYVPRDEDPRDYRVSFDKITNVLGFKAKWTVPAGIEQLQHALAEKLFDDPYAGFYRNT